MLRVDLAAVRDGPVDTAATIPTDDPLVARAGITLAAPLAVTGRFSTAGAGRYYWQAKLETLIRSECRRCLAPVAVPLSQPLGLVFVAAEVAGDDDDCYVVPRRATTVDLSGAVYEELLLAAPQFVVCRDECRGLCPRCGADLNAGPCACRPETDSRWEALTKLSKGGD